MAIHTKQVKIKVLTPKKDKKEQERKIIRDNLREEKFKKQHPEFYADPFAPYNPNNTFGLKEHQIVHYEGEYGVVVNVDEYTVRWDTNKPSDFEFGVCALPHDLIDKYEFKYINQDGTYPRTK